MLRFSGTGTRGGTIGNATTAEYYDLLFSDVDNSGNIYVVDSVESGRNRLLRVNPNGISAVVSNFPLSWGDSYPLSVAVDASGKLFVVESFYHAYIYSSSSSSSSSSFDAYNAIHEDERNRILEDERNRVYEGPVLVVI